jgi:hypothetical protein
MQQITSLSLGSPLATTPEEAIVRDGFAFVSATTMRPRLQKTGLLDDWADFAASWDELEEDSYMADRGHYRKRRHAVFSADAEGIIRREAPQPHYQSLSQ